MEMHPELGFQVGIPQETKKFEVHPSLQAEADAPADEPVVAMVENDGENAPVMVENQTTIEAAPEMLQPQEDPKERDWRAVRAQADEAKQIKREKEALERERDFYRQQALNNTKPSEPEDDYRTDTEKRLAQEMNELKRQVAQQGQQTAEAQRKAAVWKAESELMRDYPDMKQVVSNENVNRLQNEFPHLYNAAVSSDDVYAVGAAAYEFILAKGIYVKPKTTLNQMAQNNSAARNANKPRSASSISPQAGDSPIKQATSFMGGNSIASEDERQALWKEMVSASGKRI